MIDEREVTQALQNGVCDIMHQIGNKIVTTKATLQNSYFSKTLKADAAELMGKALDLGDGVKYRVLFVWDVIHQEWAAIRSDKIHSVQMNQG